MNGISASVLAQIDDLQSAYIHALDNKKGLRRNRVGQIRHSEVGPT